MTEKNKKLKTFFSVSKQLYCLLNYCFKQL